jgi:SAM-dependent methyltransferase
MTEDSAIWQAAQEEEGKLWRAYASNFEDSPPLLEYLAKLRSVCTFAQDEIADRPIRMALEIGVGPIGIGTLGANSRFEARAIVGVDPLPRLDFSCRDAALRSHVSALRDRVVYCQAIGEQLPFRGESFDLVCCHNVIDHCRVSAAVLHESWRVLKPCGFLILTVNTFSLVGRLKFEMLRLLRPHEPNFIMHPSTFTHTQIKQLAAHIGYDPRHEVGADRSLLGRSRLSSFLLLKREK